MRQELDLLYRHEITFTEFSRRTRAHWGRLADYLLGKWKMSSQSVTKEDLVQEMLLACSAAVGCTEVLDRDLCPVRPWDPTRGPTLKRYVVFQAIDRAKKVLRAHYRRSYREESVYMFEGRTGKGGAGGINERGGEYGSVDSGSSLADRSLARRGIFTAADQETVTEIRQSLERCEDWEREVAVMILDGYSPAEIASKITSYQTLREAARAPTLKLASQAAHRVARKIAS